MKLQLTVLAPVHIGAGEDKNLSHMADYFLDEKTREACYIDHQKLEKFMSEWPEPRQIVDDFVRRVRSQQAQEADKYGIKTFLEDYGANPSDFVRQRVPASSWHQIRNQAIQPTVKNAGQPYIPGSSIKGAIRTAVLYHELMSAEKNGFRNTLRQIERMTREKKWNDAKKQIANFFREVYGGCNNDGFRFLRISDTSVLPATSLRIIHAERCRLASRQETQRQNQVPMNYETIAPGMIAPFEVRCCARRDDLQRDNKLKSYFRVNGELQLLTLVNAYSLAFVQHEIDALKGHAALSAIHAFYQNELLPQLQNSREGEAILSLGRGKTYFNNSIGLSFDKDELREIRQLFRLGENRRARRLEERFPEPFPISRTVIIENNQPAGVLGWVKLRRIN